MTQGGWSAMHYASSEGHIETVECLLAAGSCTEARDKNGCTPIHYAAGEGFNKVVEALIASDADVNAKALSGWTALHYAAGSGRLKVVRCLLDAGANRSIGDQHGHSPAQVAIEAGQQKCTTLLKAYVRQPAKLVMALQRLAWSKGQISSGSGGGEDRSPAHCLSADLAQQVVRRFKLATKAGVVVRAFADAKAVWQLCIGSMVAARAAADAKKLAGNSLFQKRRYADALVVYSEAVTIDPSCHLYYCNRSACCAALGKWEASAADARKCLQLSPGFVKAHIRLGTAELHLGRFDEAVAAVQSGLQKTGHASSSGSIHLRRLLSELREKDPAIQFARARHQKRERIAGRRGSAVSVSTAGSQSTLPSHAGGGGGGGGGGGSVASHDSGDRLLGGEAGGGGGGGGYRGSGRSDGGGGGGGWGGASVGGESVALSDFTNEESVITNDSSVDDDLLELLPEVPGEEREDDADPR